MFGKHIIFQIVFRCGGHTLSVIVAGNLSAKRKNILIQTVVKMLNTDDRRGHVTDDGDKPTPTVLQFIKLISTETNYFFILLIIFRASNSSKNIR